MLGGVRGFQCFKGMCPRVIFKDQAAQSASTFLEMSGTTHPLTALNLRRPDSAVALFLNNFALNPQLLIMIFT